MTEIKIFYQIGEGESGVIIIPITFKRVIRYDGKLY